MHRSDALHPPFGFGGPRGGSGPRGPWMFGMGGPRGRGGRGRPWWAGGSGFGGPGRHGGGPRARRGDVRAAILVLLAEEPRNGYGLMQEIEQRSEGAWRPSPGSVYPALQQLEDEGLVRAEERDGRKLFALTDAGRAEAQARGEDRPAPWAAVGGSHHGPAHELFDVMRQVGMAAAQLAQVGDDEQIAQARTVLADARRALYGILAEDAGERGTPTQDV